MTNKHVFPLLTLLVLALLGCSSSKPCKKACTKIASCLGIKQDAGKAGDGTTKTGGAGDAGAAPSWTCPFSDTCSKKEACKAECYSDADCEAIKAPQASKTLQDCVAECDKQSYEAGSDGGSDATAPDRGPQLDTTCNPSCNGKSCGPDGCGGSCGNCTPPQVCNTNLGQCVSSCTPNCAGRQCGDDGCGGSCGSCSTGLKCNPAGNCEPLCVPDCAGKNCGSDGCGGSCGSCTMPMTCDASGTCVNTCAPNCSGKQCGDNGCGGSCGSCTPPATCNTAGQCGAPGCGVERSYDFSSGMQGVTETHSSTAVKWQVATKNYHSPSHVLYYGNATLWNYAGSGTNYGTATLPAELVPATGSSKLFFWLWMDTETGSSYDTLKVKAGGSTLWSKGSNVTMKTWQEHTVDLSAYAGKSVAIGFEFNTVDGSSNATQGVFLDDIRLELGCP
jgi:hypothetical protein